MGCPHCEALCVEYAIQSPENLRKAIRTAARSVSEGLLIESHPQPQWNSYRFTECARRMVWGDTLCYRFRCVYCTTLFELHAETWHGSGGGWAPVDNPGQLATVTDIHRWKRQAGQAVSFGEKIYGRIRRIFNRGHSLN